MKMNLVVINVSLIEGMAGSMRVRNLVDPLIEKKVIKVYNLALTHINEKDKIGKRGFIDGIDYLYIGYKSFKNLPEIFKFYASGFIFLKASFDKASKNIIYNYGYPDVKNFLFLRYAHYLGYKVIFDIVEDNRLAQNFSGFMGKMKVKSSVFLIKNIKNIASSVIVISEHLKNMMHDFIGNKLPIHHIPITVNFKYFPAQPQYNPGKNLKIFYGGSFNLKKDGIDYLVKAFDDLKVKYPHLFLILSGGSTLKSEMDKLHELIKGNDRIIYKGYLSVDDYYRVLNDADIFCMPRNNSSFSNAGFPFKLGEFLAAGKAVIATKVGDVSNYLINENNALLIQPESVAEMERAIIYCIENRDAAKAMGLKAKESAQKHFDSEILSKQLMEILKSV